MSDEQQTALDRRLEGTLRQDAVGLPTPMGEFKLEFLDIDPTNLEFEMSKASGDYGWIGTLMEAIRTKAESKKLDIDEAEVTLKQVEGQLYLDIVAADSHLSARDAQRRTVDAIKATVNSDQQVLHAKQRVITLKRELLELDHGRRQVSRVLMALELKGKMLQSTGANRRAVIELQLQDARAEGSVRQQKGEG